MNPNGREERKWAEKLLAWRQEDAYDRIEMLHEWRNSECAEISRQFILDHAGYVYTLDDFALALEAVEHFETEVELWWEEVNDVEPNPEDFDDV